MTRSVPAWHLRRARLEDAAEIARLVTELGYPVEAGAILPRLQALLVHPDHFVTVAAEPNDRLSGCDRGGAPRSASLWSASRDHGTERGIRCAPNGCWTRFGQGGRSLGATNRRQADRRSLECRPPRITSFLREDWLRAQEDTARLRQVVRQTRQRLRWKPHARAASGANQPSHPDGADGPSLLGSALLASRRIALEGRSRANAVPDAISS